MASLPLDDVEKNATDVEKIEWLLLGFIGSWNSEMRKCNAEVKCPREVIFNLPKMENESFLRVKCRHSPKLHKITEVLRLQFICLSRMLFIAASLGEKIEKDIEKIEKIIQELQDLGSHSSTVAGSE